MTFRSATSRRALSHTLRRSGRSVRLHTLIQAYKLFAARPTGLDAWLDEVERDGLVELEVARRLASILLDGLQYGSWA